MHWFNTCYFGLFVAIGIFGYFARDEHDRKTEKGPRTIFWIGAKTAYPILITWSSICLLISLWYGFWATHIASLILYPILDIAVFKIMEAIFIRPEPMPEKITVLVTAPKIVLIQPILKAFAPFRKLVWFGPVWKSLPHPALILMDITFFRRMTRGSAPP